MKAQNGEGEITMAARDYDHDIKQIRSALHHATGSRASLMVGSGFSLNAKPRYGSTLRFPTWAGLTESLIARLYPDNAQARERAIRNVGATSGALRIAQEFEAAFGRTVLLNHVRDMLPDQEHEPGEIHEDLLALPWADVFTTNYDTLLERAARPLRERRYEIVRTISDLPLKRSPRIVKLHGTLPELSDCILTEEDYRTYPDCFSPFVAEVQVAMVESHLCLVGFSGDDPNFLAWSGWVRDRLGQQTLPIYLWTFDEPTTFQARMLEQRSVIPLPLLHITGKTDYVAALNAFLMRLKTPIGRPGPRWCLPRHLSDEEVTEEPKCPSDAITEEHWMRIALTWRENRKRYPGWLIPHLKAIDNLWSNTERWASSADAYPASVLSLSPPACLFVNFELLWRLRRALFPAYDRLALVTWQTALQRFDAWRQDDGSQEIVVNVGSVSAELLLSNLDAAAMELRLECLRHARETGDFNSFDSSLAAIRDRLRGIAGQQRQHCEHFITHEVALAYLAKWDEKALANVLLQWDTSLAPVWALRRACLLAETGRREVAHELLEETLQLLRTVADEGAAETWSIEAWVIYNLRSLKGIARFFAEGASEETDGATARDKLPATLNWLRVRSCDPVETLEWLEDQNSREFGPTTRASRSHTFDSRRWQTHMTFASAPLQERLLAAYRMTRLVEEAGLPMRSGNVRLAASMALRSIELLTNVGAAEATGLVFRMRDLKLLDKWFSRQRIATLQVAEIRRLLGVARTSVDGLLANPERLDRDGGESQNFSAAIQLLSRVATRADEATLCELLQLCNKLPALLRLWDRWWLASDVEVLSRRVCEALSLSGSVLQVLTDVLKAPVPGSAEFPAMPPQSQWLDPVEGMHLRDTLGEPLPPETSQAIALAVGRLADIGDNAERVGERQRLIRRLITLADAGLVSLEKQIELLQAIFASRDSETGLPKDTGYLDTAVLFLPAYEGFDEHLAFRERYVKRAWPDGEQELCRVLDTVAGTGPISAESGGRRQRGIDWSAEELAEIASRCHAILEQQNPFCEDGAQSQAHAFARALGGNVAWHHEVSTRVARVLDDLVLRSPTLPSQSRTCVSDAVDRACRIGLPVLSVCPRLAIDDASLLDRFVEMVIERLCDADIVRFMDTAFALNHWANQLSDPRMPRIPRTIYAAVAGHLREDYSFKLIHIFDSVANLLQRLSSTEGCELLAYCEWAIARWASKLEYGVADNVVADVGTEFQSELPDLRASFTRLCVSSRRMGATIEPVMRWLQMVASDPMPEVRRALLPLAVAKPSADM